MLPPIPSWDALHPLIIHFPIALLLITPILILIGLFFPKKAGGFLTAAFVVMLLGTIASYVAISTGDAASELVDRTPAIEAVLERHEELADTTRSVFTALTAIFGAILFAPMLFKKPLSQTIMIPLGLAFLLFYGAGMVLLINTAHQGGRLVHEFGVRAMTGSTAQNGNNPASGEAKKTDDED